MADANENSPASAAALFHDLTYGEISQAVFSSYFDVGNLASIFMCSVKVYWDRFADKSATHIQINFEIKAIEPAWRNQARCTASISFRSFDGIQNDGWPMWLIMSRDIASDEGSIQEAKRALEIPADGSKRQQIYAITPRLQQFLAEADI